MASERKAKKKVHAFTVDEVSLVDTAANLRTFPVLKRASPMAEKTKVKAEKAGLSGYADLHIYMDPEEMVKLLSGMVSMETAQKSVTEQLSARKASLDGKEPARKSAEGLPSAEEMEALLSQFAAVGKAAADLAAKYPNLKLPEGLSFSGAVSFPDLTTTPGAGTQTGPGGDAPLSGGQAPEAVPAGAEMMQQSIIKAVDEKFAPVLKAVSDLSGVVSGLAEQVKKNAESTANVVKEEAQKAALQSKTQLEEAQKSAAEAKKLAEENAAKAAEAEKKAEEASKKAAEAEKQAEEAKKAADAARPPPAGGTGDGSPTKQPAKKSVGWGNIL